MSAQTSGPGARKPQPEAGECEDNGEAQQVGHQRHPVESARIARRTVCHRGEPSIRVFGGGPRASDRKEVGLNERLRTSYMCRLFNCFPSIKLMSNTYF